MREFQGLARDTAFDVYPGRRPISVGQAGFCLCLRRRHSGRRGGVSPLWWQSGQEGYRAELF